MSPTGTYTVGRDSIIVLCKGGRLPSWHDLTQAERDAYRQEHVDLMLDVGPRARADASRGVPAGHRARPVAALLGHGVPDARWRRGVDRGRDAATERRPRLLRVRARALALARGPGVLAIPAAGPRWCP